MVLFDTLKFSRKLEKAGFSHEQATGAAEAFSEVVSDGVATKADINKLENKIDGVEEKLENKIDGVEEKLENKIDDVEARLESKIDGVEARLESKIEGVETRLESKIETVKVGLESQIKNVDTKMDLLKSDLNSKIDQSEIRRKGDMRLVKWMFAVIIAATVIPFCAIFFN